MTVCSWMSSHAGALEIKGWGNVSHKQGIFAGYQHANPPHPLRLRARRERPGNRCSAYKRDELAPPHVEHKTTVPASPDHTNEPACPQPAG
jgi:hypothetical protein